MKVNHHQQVPSAPVEMEGAEQCTVRWLIGREDGAPNFAMRQFEVSPGGYTPKHHHPYEHEVFVLEGEGVVLEGDEEHPIRAGDVVYVAPDEVHQFRNTGQSALKFLCLVPHTEPDQAPQMAAECDAPAKP